MRDLCRMRLEPFAAPVSSFSDPFSGWLGEGAWTATRFHVMLTPAEPDPGSFAQSKQSRWGDAP
jgi:hypothetical protein